MNGVRKQCLSRASLTEKDDRHVGTRRGQLDSELLAREVKIKAAQRHQLIVVANLSDHSFLKHDDRVRLADCAQAMRDHDRGATGAEPPEIILNRALGLGVECAGRFVKNEDGRIVVNRARNRDALLLSAGKGEAGFANPSLIS